MKAPSSCETITQQEIENNVITLITALLNQQKPETSSPLGVYAGICRDLVEKMPKCPNKDASLAMLRSVRKLKQNKALDDLLRRRLDPQPQQEAKHQMRSQPVKEDGTKKGDLPELEFGMLDPELAKGASPWLDEFVQFSRKWSPRSPDIHHISVGLWLQSTISLGRVAAVDGGVIQPSLYIQLIAPSSVWAKTTVAKNGRGVLKALGLEWMMPIDRASPEKFLSSMAGTIPRNYGELTPDQQEEIRKEVAMSGKRSWYYSEFRGMLKSIFNETGRNAEFKEILLQMADGERYRNDTHNRGREEIAHPYLALLATMTPDCMKLYEKRGVSVLWMDGFYARMLFACALFENKKTREELKKQRRPNEIIVYPESLIAPLRRVHQDLGMPSCTITEVEDEEGRGTGKYVAEREEYQTKLLHMTAQAKDALDEYGDALLFAVQGEEYVQLQSSYARLRDKCLQIATSLAVMQDSSTIEIKHIARAQQLCELFRESLHKLVTYLNADSGVTKESPEEKILKLLLQNGPLTAREVTQYTHTDTQTTIRRLEILLKQGEISATKQGRKTVYCITHEGETGKV